MRRRFIVVNCSLEAGVLEYWAKRGIYPLFSSNIEIRWENKNLFEKLSIEVDYFGFVYHDPNAKHAVKNRTPYRPFAGDRPEAGSIVRIAERISGYYDRAVQDSAERLEKQAWQDYNNF